RTGPLAPDLGSWCPRTARPEAGQGAGSVPLGAAPPTLLKRTPILAVELRQDLGPGLGRKLASSDPLTITSPRPSLARKHFTDRKLLKRRSRLGLLKARGRGCENRGCRCKVW